MATGQIRITPDQLDQEANKLRNLADQHDSVFNQMTNLINALRSQWEGAAIDAFEASYENAKKELIKFRQSIDVFASDMNNSAKILRETDASLASQLKR